MRSSKKCTLLMADYRHMIYFRVTDYGIAVIRILHDRMDAPRHL
jgi:plasmid stabilization system protein ParE